MKTKKVSVSEHTPTPWSLDVLPAGYIILGDLKGKDDSGMPSHTETVGEVGQRSNAALIVRAVNCHELLVSALRELLEAIHNGPERKLEDAEIDAMRKARTAIANAEWK